MQKYSESPKKSEVNADKPNYTKDNLINHIIKNYKLLILFALLTTVFSIYEINKVRELKKEKELERIISKNYNDNICEQYALVASMSGYYPCYQTECKDGLIWLNTGEIWKYGKTCNGEMGRYPSGLPFNNLNYVPQFAGNEQDCLIQEKLKIYNYPNLPECKVRSFIIIRPPGNKIDR